MSETEAVDCVICLESLESNLQVLQFIPCLHLVHTSCALVWFKFGVSEEVCPFCKIDIFHADIFKEGNFQLPAFYQ